MKRLPLLGLGLVLALASCGSSIENDAQGLACYDTGSGLKCVPLEELPANTTATCLDDDRDSDGNDVSSGSGSDSNGDGNSDSSAEADNDSSSESLSDCANESGADTDGDGISDSQDCDCIDPYTPTNPPPPGEGGPVII